MKTHTPIHVVGYCSFGKLLFEKLDHLDRDKLNGYLYGNKVFRRKLDPAILAGNQNSEPYYKAAQRLEIGAGRFKSPASYIVEIESHWNPSLVILVVDLQDQWARNAALKHAEELSVNGISVLAIVIENYQSGPLGYRRRLLEYVIGISIIHLDFNIDVLQASELASLECADIVDGLRLLFNSSEQYQKFNIRDLKQLFLSGRYFRIQLATGKDPAAIEDANKLLQVEGKEMLNLFEPKAYHFCMITKAANFDYDEILDILKDVNYMVGNRVSSKWTMQHSEELGDSVLVEICLLVGNPISIGIRKN